MNSGDALLWTPDPQNLKVPILFFLGDVPMLLLQISKLQAKCVDSICILRSLEGITGITASNNYPVK